MTVTRIRLRRGTAAAWAAADPVMAAGEAGVDLDTGELRIGDGTAAWSTLTPIGAVDTADIAAAVEAYLIANPPAMGAHAASHATTGDDAIAPADIGAAAASHTHGLADLTDAGGAAALDVGTTAGTVAAGDDARLSDARTPTAHAAGHKTGGADALTAADIGASATGHTHDYAASSHTHTASAISDATITAGASVSGSNTGDQDLSGYVPTSRTVAGKALTGDITLAASDVGAVATGADAADLTSGTATDGYVLTADGSGGAAWESLPAETLPASIIAAKGDLIVGTANDTAAVLSVGTNGYVPKAASGESTGIKWTPPGEGSVNTVATSGSAQTLSAATELHDVTMSENCTFTFTSPAAGAVFALRLAGAYTPTWPASVKWPDGTAPTYATPSLYVFCTFNGGTTWAGVSAGKAFA